MSLGAVVAGKQLSGIDVLRARAGVVGLVLLQSWACSQPVAALEAGPVSLAWRAPTGAGCTSAQDIQGRLARLTDQTVSLTAAPGGLTIEADLAASEPGWQARITLVDNHGKTVGSRQVHARLPDCQALDVPVVLVLATMLDDLREREQRSAAMSGDRDRRASRLGLGVSATGALGLGPDPWLGTTLLVEPALDAIRLPLEVSAYLPTEQLDKRGRGARSFGFHAGASLCTRVFGSHALELQLCTGGQLGGIWAKGVGLTRNESGVLPMLLLDLEPKLSLTLSDHIAIQFALAASWVPLRPDFAFQIEGEAPHSLHGGPFAVIGRIGMITFPAAGHR